MGWEGWTGWVGALVVISVVCWLPFIASNDLRSMANRCKIPSRHIAARQIDLHSFWLLSSTSLERVGHCPRLTRHIHRSKGYCDVSSSSVRDHMLFRF